MINKNPKKLPVNYTNFFDFLHEKTKISSSYSNAKKIVISDCDGIITTGLSIYDKSGKKEKIYGAYDKEMLKYLSMYNWNYFFITDDISGIDITYSRLKHLKKSIKNFNYGNKNAIQRLELVNEYMAKNYIVVFIGDSLSDIPSISAATYGGCTNNSPALVKEYCKFISVLNGGYGGLADILFECHTYINKKHFNV